MCSGRQWFSSTVGSLKREETAESLVILVAGLSRRYLVQSPWKSSSLDTLLAHGQVDKSEDIVFDQDGKA